MTDEMVGDADREAARADLQRQWDQGLLDASEHERRTTAVRHARTRQELDRALHGVQPGYGATGPVLPPVEPRPGSAASSPPRPLTPEPAADNSRTGGLIKLDRKTAATVVALTPLVCFALVVFFRLPWAVFVLWFAMPILVYGPDGRHEYRAERHERRARRHAAKAARHRRRLDGREGRP